MVRSVVTLAAVAILFSLATGSPTFGQSTDVLRRMDANSNGRLEPSEVPSTYRSSLDAIARRYGIDPSKPISIDAIQRAAQSGGQNNDDNNDRDRRRDRDRGDRDRGDGDRGERRGWGGPPPGWGGPPGGPGGWGRRGDDRRDGDEKKEEAGPITPGFGEPSNLSPARGFDGQLLESSYISVSLEELYDQRVLTYVDQRLLGRYDRNHDGYLDATEIEFVPWGDEPAQDDENQDGSLSRGELAERTVRLWGYGRKAPRDESMVAANKGVAGIDPKQMEQYSRYAESVLRRYDENRNGYLEPDEWKNSRSINDSTDLNNDKRVTTDEMVKHFASFANRGRNSQNNGSSQQNNSSRENSDRGNSDRDDRGRPGRGSWRDQRNDQRGGNNGPGGPRSNDRNSKNLPSWFVGKDADNDGQVAMAEFSTAWSERDVAEFQKYDHNGDGIITPAEATGTSSSAQIASPSPPTYRAR